LTDEWSRTFVSAGSGALKGDSPSCFDRYFDSRFGFRAAGGPAFDFCSASHAAAFANAAARSAFALNPTAVAPDSDVGRPLGCLVAGNDGK
jgi:hypothetical protein